MHNAINYPSPAAMETAIETVHHHFPDIDQQVTELDMSVYNAGDTKSNYGNNVPPLFGRAGMALQTVLRCLQAPAPQNQRGHLLGHRR